LQRSVGREGWEPISQFWGRKKVQQIKNLWVWEVKEAGCEIDYGKKRETAIQTYKKKRACVGLTVIEHVPPGRKAKVGPEEDGEKRETRSRLKSNLVKSC